MIQLFLTQFFSICTAKKISQPVFDMEKQKTKNRESRIYTKPDAVLPLTVLATAGDLKGEIDLFWEPVRGANTYVIQKSSARKENIKWNQVDIVDKSSYTITGLKSGNKYWFRVAPVSTKGQGLWSTPVQKKAP